MMKQESPNTQPPKRQKVDLRGNNNGQPKHYDIDYNAEDAGTSLLHYEVEELLKGAVFDQQTSSTIEAWIAKLAKALRNLPQCVVDPRPVSSLVRRMNFPISRLFTFQAPETVEIVGSFAYKATLRAPNACIDVALVMPNTCFDEKDQLNNRYFAKRALYLAHVGTKLLDLQTLDIASARWTLQDGDIRLPTLLLTPGTNSEVDSITVRLIPCLNFAVFPMRKLGPEKNNLRSANKAMVIEGDTGKDADGQRQVPTPNYNTAIVKDMMVLQHAKKIKATASKVPGFAGASVLLRLWLENNGIHEGGDGISPFFLTMLLLYLLDSGKVYPEMRPIQLFRMTVLSLSNLKLLSKDGLKMHQASDLAAASSHQKPPLPRTWQTIGQEVVFIDMSGWLNLAASMSAAALQQAQYAASNTVALLSTSINSEALDRLFLRRQPLAILYDSWFRIRLQPDSNGVDGQFNTDTLPWQDYDAKIEAIAKKGLRARAKLVRVIRRTAVLPQGDDTDFETCFADGSNVHAGPDRGEVLLGVRLDPTMAYKTVDVGPAAEKKALAAEFRSFWGEKAELRRFQDGKIAESVVWDVSPAEVHGIVANIVKYVVHRHVSKTARIFEITTALDSALIRKGHTAEDDIIAERLLNSAATQLGKRLRAMDDTNLPLKVISTQPLSPVLRHAAVFPPLPHPLAGASTATFKESLADDGVVPRCLEPIEILCKLEGTGKWPDDPTAYLKTKAAIGIQLAKALHSKHGLYAQAAEDYIDVLSDGFAFRLLLITERESGGSISDVGFRDLLDLRVWQQGLVSQTSGVNPSFAPALRLAKRWIASQWLSPHVCEEAVELLMVAVYSDVHINGGAASLPASPVAGFLQFLTLLAEHPWSLIPFVLPTNDVKKRSRADAAQTSRSADSYLAYDKLKASNAAPAMYIVGPQPEKCVLWTQNTPSRAVLYRAIVLARRTSQLIKSVLTGEGLNGTVNISNTPALAAETLVEAIFAHDECEYDILIHLRKDALPRVNQIEVDHLENTPKSSPIWKVLHAPEVSRDIAKKTRAVLSGIPVRVLKSRGGAHVRKELLIGFEPVEMYVEQLMQRFSSVGVVCADYCGGSRVGIKLFGNILKPGPVRPEVAHVLKPEDPNQGSHKTVMDVVSIAEDAIVLGTGLVERVEYRPRF